ncbi:MAG TPA: ubiquinol-cytochrome C chaperone family protein, partial [Xanthobacteraceae bacterium]|nr:ubiquinol-cytochrome C chaperone family protein [Xanthobacteraceae bacterium]
IVAQARTPAFYADLGVPDTVSGRFDMMVLHVYLAYRRLASQSATRAAGQKLFDRFCADMDGTLRERGVGDLAVPRKMRAIGEAFYGRAQVYDAALAAADDAALAAALEKNVFGGASGSAAQGRRLAAYVRRTEVLLAQLDAEAIVGGSLVFPEPAGANA